MRGFAKPLSFKRARTGSNPVPSAFARRSGLRRTQSAIFLAKERLFIMHLFQSDTYKIQISDFLSQYLTHQSELLNRFPLDRELLSKLKEMVLAGKMNRGKIIMEVARSFGSKYEASEIIKTAGAMELFETGLLVQDDVMDEDPVRRGLPSLQIAFADLKNPLKPDTRKRFGESVATCVGDLAFYMAFDILHQINIESKIKNKLLDLFTHEMKLVTLAQIDDIFLADLTSGVSESDTLKMYYGKTSRYSIVLPFQAGAILGDQSDKILGKLEVIGNEAGLIYQLTDDTIGFLGNEKTIGKPVGSDIREGKKTIFYHFALKKLTGKDKQQFMSLYGKKDITSVEITFVRELILKCKADLYVAEIIKKCQQKINYEISNKLLPQTVVDTITLLVSYLSGRKK
jgi:geranylgeranyl diphosphate synthase, type I